MDSVNLILKSLIRCRQFSLFFCSLPLRGHSFLLFLFVNFIDHFRHAFEDSCAFSFVSYIDIHALKFRNSLPNLFIPKELLQLFFGVCALGPSRIYLFNVVTVKYFLVLFCGVFLVIEGLLFVNIRHSVEN